MKKLTLIIAIVFSGMLMQAQVELKGYKLGEVYSGPKEIFTTVGGESGYLTLMVTHDNKIFFMYFQALKEKGSGDLSYFSGSKLISLINGFENKYGVYVDKFAEHEIGVMEWEVIQNHVYFQIESQPRMSNEGEPEYTFSFGIMDNILEKEFKKYKQNLVNRDF